MKTHRIRTTAWIIFSGLAIASVAVASTTRFYAGNICSPEALSLAQWNADFGGLANTKSGTGVGLAYCAIEHPDSDFTPTRWQVNYFDGTSGDCVRCNLFIRSTAGGTMFTEERFSAVESGGRFDCSNAGFTGHGFLSLDMSSGAELDVAHVVMRCQLPENDGAAFSSILRYQLTHD